MEKNKTQIKLIPQILLYFTSKSLMGCSFSFQDISIASHAGNCFPLPRMNVFASLFLLKKFNTHCPQPRTHTHHFLTELRLIGQIVSASLVCVCASVCRGCLCHVASVLRCDSLPAFLPLPPACRTATKLPSQTPCVSAQTAAARARPNSGRISGLVRNPSVGAEGGSG